MVSIKCHSHHTTVLHSINKIEAMRRTVELDSIIQQMMNAATQQLATMS